MENGAPPSEISVGSVGALLPAGTADVSARASGRVAATRESLRRLWVATWGRAQETRTNRLATIVQGGLPLVALIVSASLIVIGHESATEPGLVDVVALTVIILAGIRQTLLVHDRGRLLRDSA